MKKTSIICLLTCLTLLLTANVYATQENSALETTIPVIEEVMATTGSCSTLDAKNSFFSNLEDIDNAESVLLYEVTTDTLMYARNPDTQIYPSSLTKIMTALLVLENSNLSDEVTVKQTILNEMPIGAAIAGLHGDEIITVESLLYSMMVDSANDSAAILADYVAGSQEAFISMMNARAAEIGCTGTNFVNVHGLYDDEQLSTARDIAKIVKEAIKNEKFVEIFGTAYYTIPATNKSEERDLVSGNFLMTRGDIQVYYDHRVTGGRTGVTPSGLRMIAATAQSGNLQMISVVTGSESTYKKNSSAIESFGSFEETTKLLDYGFNGISARQVLYPNQALKQYVVENGDNDLVVGPDISTIAVLPDKVNSKDLLYRYTEYQSKLEAPIEKGDKISAVEIFYNGSIIASADLYAMNSVAVKSATPGNPALQKHRSIVPILLVIIGIMAVVIIFLFGSRYVHMLRLKARRKRMCTPHKRRR